MSDAQPIITALAAGLSLLFLGLSHRANRRRRLVKALPTSQVHGVFIGLSELKGTAETEAPFSTRLSKRPCVLYSWKVSEHWRRTVHENYKDAQGRSQTRTRVESGSTVVASGGESAPFYLRDESGVILVRPEGAEVKSSTLFAETCTPLDSLYYKKGPAGAIPNSTFTRTFYETGIVLHSRIFLVGQARERQDVVAPEIASAEGVPMFLITVETEEQVVRGYGNSLHVWAALGLIAAGGAAWLGWEYWPTVFAAAGLYLTLWLCTWIWMFYNSLVDTRNRVRQGWSQIDVQLKRRHDLIPNLVSVVEELRGHERETQESLAAMRNQLQASPKGERGPDFQGLVTTVIGIAEAYPELKSATAFLDLQRQLVETEQRIALARAYYNDIATAYNTRLEVMPEAIIAKLRGFRLVNLLESSGFERATVDVHLAD